MNEGGEVSARIGVQVATQDSALADLQRRFEALKEEIREVRREGRSAGQETTSAFAELREELGGTLVQFASVTAAIGLVKEGMQEIGRLRDQAAQSNAGAEQSMAALAQLAGDDRAKLLELQGAARDIYREGGARSLDEAAKLTFDLESSGALGERQFFSRLGVVEPNVQGVLQGATTLRANLGEGETGSFQEIVSKAFAAAGPVAGASPSDILMASARGAGSARALGLSDEELLGAISVAAQKARSPEEASTNVSSLLQVLMTKGFGEEMRGQGLGAMIRSIDAQGLSGSQLVEYLGSVEASRGYFALSGGGLEERTRMIRDASGLDLGGAAAANALGTGAVRAPFEARLAGGQRELAYSGIGSSRALSDAAIDRYQEAVLRGEVGVGAAGLLGREAAAGLAGLSARSGRFFAGDDATTDAIARKLPEDDRRAIREAQTVINNTTVINNYGGPEDSSGGVN